jgi:hypothetical protein
LIVQVTRYPFDERPPADRDHRLGDIRMQMPDSGSQPACQDHRRPISKRRAQTFE